LLNWYCPWAQLRTTVIHFGLAPLPSIRYRKTSNHIEVSSNDIEIPVFTGNVKALLLGSAYVGPVVTFIDPEDHVPPIGVTLCAALKSVCARAEAEAVRKNARDLRSICVNA